MFQKSSLSFFKGVHLTFEFMFLDPTIERNMFLKFLLNLEKNLDQI